MSEGLADEQVGESGEGGEDRPPIEGAREATPRSELWLYAGAAVSYVVCGFFVQQIFAWWWFGAAWLVLYVWLVPLMRDRVVAWRRGNES